MMININWKKIAEVSGQPIIITDKNGDVIFSNDCIELIAGRKLDGCNINEIIDPIISLSEKNSYANIFGHSVKITNIIKDEESVIYLFMSVLDDHSIVQKFLNDANVFAFYAPINGDFLLTTKKMRKLLNISSDKVLDVDGWEHLSNTLKNIGLSGSGIKRMFETGGNFETNVPIGAFEGKKIRWQTSKYIVEGQEFILAIGVEGTEKEIHRSMKENFLACADKTLVPVLLMDKDGVIFANQAMNLDLHELGAGFENDCKTIFTDEKECRRVKEIFNDVCAGRGRMLDCTMKIRHKNYHVNEYAVRVFSQEIENEQYLILFAIPIGGLLGKIRDFTRKEKLLSLYNVILNYLVRADDVKTALTLVTGEMSSFLFSKNACLREIKGDDDKVFWHNCKLSGTGIVCPIGKTMVAKAISSNVTQVQSGVTAGLIDVCIPICLSYNENYVICLHFTDLTPEMVEMFSDLRKILEIGLTAIKTRLELQEQTVHLEKLNQFRSDIMEAVNHDLRTPLVSVKGYAELLQMEILSDDEKKESIETIINSADHLNRLIDELSDYTSMITVSSKTKSETVIDLCSFASGISKMLIPIYRKKRIEFVCEIPELPLHISADKTKLEQMLINILGNASKFTPKGGKVICRVEDIEGSHVKLTVSDNGKGVSSENHDRIFTRYGRVDVKKDGKGLGLFLTKKYVESIGGKIGLSSPGELDGATFYILFPVVK